jgi:hypothetical protein
MRRRSQFDGIRGALTALYGEGQPEGLTARTNSIRCLDATLFDWEMGIR